MYAMTGDNAWGVSHAPGLARVLADHVATGKSDLANIAPWRIDRFADQFKRASDVAEAVDHFHENRAKRSTEGG